MPWFADKTADAEKGIRIPVRPVAHIHFSVYLNSHQHALPSSAEFNRLFQEWWPSHTQDPVRQIGYVLMKSGAIKLARTRAVNSRLDSAYMELARALGVGQQEEERLRAATHVLEILAADPLCAPRPGLWASIGAACAAALSHEGVILDMNNGRVLPIEMYDAPLPRRGQVRLIDQIAFTWHTKDDLYQIRSRGMARFGLPDLELQGVPESLATPASGMLAGAGLALAQKAARSVLGQEKPPRVIVFPHTLNCTLCHIAGALGRGLRNPANALLSFPFGIRCEGDEHKVENATIQITCPPNFPGGHSQWLASALALLFAPENGKEPLIDLPETEEDPLAAAHRQAIQELPEVRDRFSTGLPPDQLLAIKCGFASPDAETEYMWVRVRQWTDSGISGELMNRPMHHPDLREEQVVEVAVADFFDWIIMHKDGSREGGYTDAVLQSEGSMVLPEEAEEPSIPTSGTATPSPQEPDTDNEMLEIPVQSAVTIPMHVAYDAGRIPPLTQADMGKTFLEWWDTHTESHLRTEGHELFRRGSLVLHEPEPRAGYADLLQWAERMKPGPAEARRLSTATHIVTIQGRGRLVPPLAALWCSIGAARAVARQTGGVIIDGMTMRPASVSSYETRLPAEGMPILMEHTFLMAVADGDAFTFRLVGVPKFGVPEVRLRRVPAALNTGQLKCILFGIGQVLVLHSLKMIFDLGSPPAISFPDPMRLPIRAVAVAIHCELKHEAETRSTQFGLRLSIEKDGSPFLDIVAPPEFPGSHGEWLRSLVADLYADSDPFLHEQPHQQATQAPARLSAGDPDAAAIAPVRGTAGESHVSEAPPSPASAPQMQAPPHSAPDQHEHPAMGGVPDTSDVHQGPGKQPDAPQALPPAPAREEKPVPVTEEHAPAATTPEALSSPASAGQQAPKSSADAITAAVQRARHELPEVYQRFAKGLRTGESLFLKCVVRIGGHAEPVWLAIDHWLPESVSGRVAVSAKHESGPQQGQVLIVPIADVIDWMMRLADGSVQGAYTEQLARGQK